MTPSALSIWTLFVVVGLATFLLRGSVLVMPLRELSRGPLRRLLPLVPAAVLAPIALSSLLGTEGWGPETPARLIAGAVGGMTAWWTRSVVLTLSLGMITLWSVQALFG